MNAKDFMIENLQDQIVEEHPSFWHRQNIPPREKRADDTAIAFGDMMRENGLTLSIAESCTGGMLAQRLTAIPGASDYLMCGVVSYSNFSKMNILGIHEEDLIKYGAVSEQIAIKMAEKARDIGRASMGIGITGIAGPDGRVGDKPVGLVYIAINMSPDSKKTKSWKYNFEGSRDEVRQQACSAALFEATREVLYSK